MELYVQKYSDDLTVILSKSGQVIGIFEDMADARDAYLGYLNSVDRINYDNCGIHYAA